MRWKWNIC